MADAFNWGIHPFRLFSCHVFSPISRLPPLQVVVSIGLIGLAPYYFNR
jgi:hypothetical protein